MNNSGSDIVNALAHSNTARWNYGQPYGAPVAISYSFMERLPDYYFGSFTGFRTFNETMRVSARQALSSWERAANITFVEVSDAGSGGQIRFGASRLSNSEQARAYFPSGYNAGIDGDVWMNASISGNFSPTPGSYPYEVLLHEIGHALGLKHPGNYNAGGGRMPGPFLPSALDNTNNTVMSYNNVGGYKTDIGPYDRLAIGYLYGPRLPGAIGNLTSYGNGDDVVTGDSAANFLVGNGGNDHLIGRAGNDGLLGGDGHDRLEGGDGNDTINGNQGSDFVFGGSGNDSVRGGKDADAVYGDDGNDDVYGDMGNDLVSGGPGYDTLHGGRDDDTLLGGDGGDELWGDRGNDTLTGGAGFDWFRFTSDSGHDVITDFDVVRDWLTVSSRINGMAILSKSDLMTRMTDTAPGCLVDFGNGNDVLLLNIKKSQLSSEDIYISYL